MRLLLKELLKLFLVVFNVALLILGLVLVAWGIYSGAVDLEYSKGCFMLLAASTAGATGKFLQDILK